MGADHTVQLVSFFLVLAWLIAYVVRACLCVFRDEKIAYEAVHVHDSSRTDIVHRTLAGRTRSAYVT